MFSKLDHAAINADFRRWVMKPPPRIEKHHRPGASNNNKRQIFARLREVDLNTLSGLRFVVSSGCTEGQSERTQARTLYGGRNCPAARDFGIDSRRPRLGIKRPIGRIAQCEDVIVLNLRCALSWPYDRRAKCDRLNLARHSSWRAF